MTIAERLAYNRAYAPKLNPKIWDDENNLLPEVKEKILEIVDKFLEYANVDIKVADIKLVGSNASFNYNDDSDLDVHIVTDLSKIADPESIARLYMDSIKKTFKEGYDITIRGINVEMYVEDIKTSAQSNGVYSVMKDEWTKKPKPMRDPTPEEFAEAEEIEEELISRLEFTDDPLEISDILDEIYLGRKDALAKDGETAPFNLAFKSLRNKGILKQANDFIKEKESEELSLESKEISEALVGTSWMGQPTTRTPQVSGKGFSKVIEKDGHKVEIRKGDTSDVYYDIYIDGINYGYSQNLWAIENQYLDRLIAEMNPGKSELMIRGRDLIKRKRLPNGTVITERKHVNEDIEYKGFTIEEQPWTFTIGDQTHKTTNIFVRKDNFLYTPIEDNRDGNGEDWIERPCETVEDAKHFIDNINHAYYKKSQIPS